MNPEHPRIARILRVLHSANKAHAKGLITKRKLNSIRRRLPILGKRIHYLDRKRREHRAKSDESGDMLARITRTVRAGGVVAALDTGFYTEPGLPPRLEEIGIARWSAGSATYENIATELGIHRIDNNVEHPRPRKQIFFGPRNTGRFRFGTSSAMGSAEAVAHAQAAAASADVILLYSAHQDMELLGLRPWSENIVDLSELAWIWYKGRSPTLTNFCEGRGIEVKFPHNSGNDAACTLALGLDLAKDLSQIGKEMRRAYLTAVHRRSEKYAQIMAPSRTVVGQRHKGSGAPAARPSSLAAESGECNG